jgi:hypothetical protein
MAKKIASVVYIVDSLVIGLGGFGHGSQAAHVHAALDGLAIDPNVASMIFVVWYFVSGCMLTFGALLLWAWWRLRAGDRRPLAVPLLIGALYSGIGVFGLIYRAGDPFMGFFLVLGLLLLGSALVLAPAAAPTRG